MKLKALLLSLFVLLPAIAAAQSGYVTVTGTIGTYPGGQITATFQNQSSAPQLPLLNGSVFPTTAVGNLDFSGKFTVTVADNLVIQPTPSQWQFILCSKTGNPQQPCYPVTLTITCVGNPSCSGNTLDISSSFSGAPTPITTPQVTIGTVTTLPTGQPATVTNSGVYPQTVLNFGLPAGTPGSTVGLVDATLFPGADIGAQTMAAFASCSDAAPCHVWIKAGVYTDSTPILMPHMSKGLELTIDRNATLNYTGTGDAIGTSVAVSSGNGGGTLIDGGGAIYGTSAANSGIHIRPAHNVTVRDMTVKNFTGGFGIWVDGANMVTLVGNTSNGNLKALFVSGNMCNPSNQCNWDINSSHTWVNSNYPGATGYAPNAVKALFNSFTQSIQWGIEEMTVVGGSVSPAFDNDYSDDDLEGNGTGGSAYGAALTGLSTGTRFASDYFEGSPRGIVEGCTSGETGVTVPTGYNQQFCGNAQKTVVRDNFFNDIGTTDEVFLAHSIGTTVIDNHVNGTSTCLVNEGNAIGNIHIGFNQVPGSTAEVCSGNAAGGDLLNYTMDADATNHRTVAKGNFDVAGTLLAGNLLTANNIWNDNNATVTVSALNTPVDIPGTATANNSVLILVEDAVSHTSGAWLVQKSVSYTQIGGTATVIAINWNSSSNAITVAKTSGTVPATMHYSVIAFGN